MADKQPTTKSKRVRRSLLTDSTKKRRKLDRDREYAKKRREAEALSKESAVNIWGQIRRWNDFKTYNRILDDEQAAQVLLDHFESWKSEMEAVSLSTPSRSTGTARVFSSAPRPHFTASTDKTIMSTPADRNVAPDLRYISEVSSIHGSDSQKTSSSEAVSGPSVVHEQSEQQLEVSQDITSDELKMELMKTDTSLLPVLKQIVEFCVNHLNEETESMNQIKATCEQIWGHESYCDQIKSCCDQVMCKIHKTSQSIIHLCQTLTNLNITPESSKEEFVAKPVRSNKAFVEKTITSAQSDDRGNVEKEIKSRRLRKRCSTVKRSETESSNDSSNVQSDSNQGSYMVAIPDLEDELPTIHLTKIKSEPHDIRSCQSQQARENTTSHDVRNDQSQHLKDKRRLDDEEDDQTDFIDVDSCQEDGKEKSDILDRSHERKNDLPSSESTKDTNESSGGEERFKKLNPVPKELIVDSKNIQPRKKEVGRKRVREKKKEEKMKDKERRAEEKGMEKEKKRIEREKKEEEKRKKQEEMVPRSGICEVCGNYFKDLRKHMIIHKEKLFLCTQCDYKTMTYIRLRDHMVTHSTERNFQCGVCGRTFKTLGVLRSHELCHSGTKPYKCSVCNKAFLKKSHLKVHERIHSGTGDYECEVCGKRTRQAYNLVIHMRTHTGHKPFSCKRCGRQFAHNVSVREHKCISALSSDETRN